MNANMPTTFESFYFFQLLDKIRANGRQHYPKEDVSFLETLLAFMETEEDAHSSIEKIAIAQDTSDLAIFFSDILEQLHLMPPDNSMERLEERAGDFSDLFQLYLQSEDWKESFTTNIINGNGNAVAEDVQEENTFQPEAEDTPIETQVSLEEYCDSILREKIQQQTTALPPERAKRFEKQLQQFIEEPLLAHQLAEHVHVSEASEFRDIVSTLSTRGSAKAEDVMQEFNARAEKLLHLFYNLQETSQSAIDKVLQPEEEMAEEPLENLFADAETLIGEDEPIDFANIEMQSSEVTDEEFDQNPLRSSEPTEEERERRKFLKDYVTGEVASFSTEVIDKLDVIIDDPGNESGFHELQESLKGLHDLGQIHSYPAIEELSGNLTNLFNELNDSGKAVPGTARAKLSALLATLPNYIEAALDEQEKITVTEMNSKLADFKASLFESSEGAEINELKTMRDSFQDIFSRSTQKIASDIGEPNFEIEDLNPTFENLAYWTQLLKLDNAADAVAKLKNFIVENNVSEMNAEARVNLQSIVGKLEYVDLDADTSVWQTYLSPLSEPLEEDHAVSVTSALSAMKDVGVRTIAQLSSKLEDGVKAASLAVDELPTMLGTLDAQAALIGDSELTEMTATLKYTMNELESAAILNNSQAETQLAQFLESLKAAVGALPATPPTTTLAEQLRAIAEAEEQELEFEGFTAESAGFLSDDSSEEFISTMSDETVNDIMDIFRKEAQVYIKEIRAHLETLRSDINSEEAWKGMGVSAHTLKGSSQMVGQNYVASLAEPLDGAIEQAENGELVKSSILVAILADITAHIDGGLRGEEKDSADVLKRLSAYAAGDLSAEVLDDEDMIDDLEELSFAVEESADDAVETPEEEAEEDVILNLLGEDEPEEAEEEAAAEQLAETDEVEEAETEVADMVAEALTEEATETDDLIVLKEEDPELLQIFDSEVTNNFDLIEKNLTNLTKFGYDKEALQQIERAVHEIRGAAKMLGISEIAKITDKLERIFELLVQRRHDDLNGVITVTRRSMVVIRELTTNHKVKRELYDEVDERLEHIINNYDEPAAAANAATSGSDGDDSSASIDTATLLGAGAAAAATTFLDDEPEAVLEEEEEEERPKPAPHLLELYIQEAREQIDDINYLLLKLEKNPENEELQHHLMRCMHTLKGSSGMVHASHIEVLSHRCEDILEKTLNDKVPMPVDLFNVLFEVVDEITLILDHFQVDAVEKTKNFADVKTKLNEYHSQIDPVGNASSSAIEPSAAEQKRASSPSLEQETGSEKQKATYLRLNINKMNHLLNLAAELVVSNNQFKTQLDRLKNFFPMLNSNLKVFRDTEDYISTTLREEKRIQESLHKMVEDSPGTQESLKKQVDNIQRTLKNIRSLQDEITSITHTLKENSKAYDENLQKLNKLSNELLDEIMQARLVRIDLLFQRFHRPIRDLANQLQKQIKLKISGQDTELDRTLIDELYEPLLHIVRNSIDHGLETVEEREAAGKDPEGTLSIKAYRDRNQVIVEVKDDGKGIDIERVKEKALEKGLLKAEDTERMTEQEIFEYLFYPGFSTATETTMVSGRGVGLDAVKTQIEKAKGDIRMSTELGKGTTISIRVPISLSVIQSMLTEVAGQIYSVPLLQVEETLHVSAEDLIYEDENYLIRYREKKIPVVMLSRLLKIREDAETRLSSSGSFPVIMVQDEGQRVALLVDKIIRREEILIKSLGPGLRRLKYISGGSIMADGQVVLVIDIPQIIQDFQRGIAQAPESPAAVVTTVEPVEPPRPARKKPTRKRIEGRKPMALIVDDSLSIRKYLSSLLIQKGYQTSTARNGYEALELLNKQDFDIMVTDLEMPKLSGYELIETVRYDKRFSGFPIIVLTGRAGENFRQLTSELGADAYIVKPFKDRELFDQLERFIDYKM
ncbi:MAG: Hpt domain-containing protein [Calditrichia bacterium]